MEMRRFRYSFDHMYKPEMDWSWQTQFYIEIAKRKARSYFDRIRKDERLWK